jgi:hypothetical protein
MKEETLAKAKALKQLIEQYMRRNACRAGRYGVYLSR